METESTYTICFAALPVGEYLNYRLQKLNGSYKSERINQRILALCEVIAGIDKYKKVKGCVVFELGTGWNAINPLVFYLISPNFFGRSLRKF